jgi:hypothetical protein
MQNTNIIFKSYVQWEYFKSVFYGENNYPLTSNRSIIDTLNSLDIRPREEDNEHDEESEPGSYVCSFYLNYLNFNI